MPITCDLDHVAVACERQADAWPRYAGDLAGQWMGSGTAPGFGTAQVSYANGMTVEVLEPYQPEVNDFLRRFLDHRGPGPHHLTFKTGDIDAALAVVEAAGYRPVGVDLSDPTWKEAFLHPKDAPGVVIQIAESVGDSWWNPPPDDFPPARTATTATLLRVVHAVADLDEGRRLFIDLLGGEPVGEGDDHVEGARWLDVRWPGPGVVRVVAPADPSSSLITWLGGQAGRLHHLAFATEAPAAIADAKPIGDGRFEIGPDDNLGMRLLLEPTGYAGRHGREDG